MVEDEPGVAVIINKGLTEIGHRITVAPDGHTGLEMALNNEFDVMILDIMLPGINGMQLCKTLREQKINTPILLLTALGTTENIVVGLNAGADDYLVKPFKFAELEARLRSLNRRKQMPLQDKQVLYVGDIMVDFDAKRIERAGQPVVLTPTEFRLFEYFVRNKNKVLSRIQILEHVWGIDFNMGTNVVDVYVNYLRKKLNQQTEQKLIETVVGMGYIMKI